MFLSLGINTQWFRGLFSIAELRQHAMAPGTAELPPLDGSISHVLPGFVDFHAKYNPDRPCYVFPYPSLESDELRTTSYLEFAQATHRAAHHFRPNREGPEGTVVALILNIDTLLYHAILVGLIRAGCVPFAMSPRNSAPAIASMMEHTQCHRVISQPAFAELMSNVRDALSRGHEMRVDDPPAFTSIYPSLAPSSTNGPASEPYPPPPEQPPFTSVAFYLHSSGSTGHPKPVPQTHEFVLRWCSCSTVSHSRTHGVRWGVHALPPFHTMGIASQLLAPLVAGHPSSLFPPSAVQASPPVIPTPDATIDNARKTGCNAIFSVPTFLEVRAGTPRLEGLSLTFTASQKWAQSEDDIEYLKTLKYLVRI